jgi:predicted transcriptional regulator
MIFGNKRSESEILLQILFTAEKEAKKTQLLHNANISYTHFIKYFNFLLEKKLIEIKNENQLGTVYHITEKGKNILKDINNLLNQIN